MDRTKEQLLAEALSLPEPDRAELADRLYDSVERRIDPEIESAWIEEVERRIDELDAGRTKTMPWPEAQRRIAGDESGGPPN